MTSPIYVAIDTPELEKARDIVAKVKHHVGGIKLGLEFFSANGRAGVREMAQLGLPIFLDLKLHDIPNTVGKAVQTLAPLKPAILTVHAAGGRAMMEDAKAAAPTGTKVVAVTVLTSLDGTDLQSIGVNASPHDQVERYYSLIDVLAYPRKKMRLTDLVTPLKPLEAMAQGKLPVPGKIRFID